MPRAFRATNKRLIQRASGGQFRRSILADFGMAHCDKCGSIYSPDLSQFNFGFIDPSALRKVMDTCPNCGHVSGCEKTQEMP